jgi:hypothetical protein
MPDFYQDKFTRGNPAEYIVYELCRSRGLKAELNPAPEEDLEARRGWDILIEGVHYEIKSDWYSWKSHNICVEKASLDHTCSTFFIYALPRPSQIYFHVFPVAKLRELYEAKVTGANDHGDYYQVYAYLHKKVGDQVDNEAVLLPEEITKTVGMPFWQATKQ